MNNISFLKTDGEMAALTQNFDWENSPVGAPEGWPQSLKTIVSMILHSKFPMFLWWGDDLVQFYNDAYRPSLGNNGKHPLALGQRGEECWPEIWPTIKPLIDQVKNTGVATWSDNQLIPIFRNGRMEDVYWTFGYSAVLNETGDIGGVLVVCQEMTQMVIGKKKLEESEARFRSIIEQAPVAIALVNGPEMEIRVGNDSMFQLWGKDKSVVGMPLLDALPEIKEQGFLEILENVYQTGEPYVGHSIPAKLERDGFSQDHYFDIVFSPSRNEEHEVKGILISAVEVTNQVLSKHNIENSEARYRTLSQELEQQVHDRTSQLHTIVGDLKRSNENLQQFAYVASHDLQEPLRKIQSFGDLLKKQVSENSVITAGYIDRMQSAATRMSTLINDLLSYSRIPILPALTEPISINKIVELVLIDLELLIEQTGASITVGPLPQLRGDASQLGQLFQNLLGNALKFHKPGIAPVVEIQSRIVQANELANHIKPSHLCTSYYCIEVTDNGVGFDNKHLSRIFQVFQRLHGKSEFPGSGIGLSICEKIVANHGGAITASSQPGYGSTFSVYMPAE